MNFIRIGLNVVSLAVNGIWITKSWNIVDQLKYDKKKKLVILYELLYTCVL